MGLRPMFVQCTDEDITGVMARPLRYGENIVLQLADADRSQLNFNGKHAWVGKWIHLAKFD